MNGTVFRVMLKTPAMKSEDFQNCINACLECMTACRLCATACLNETHVSHLVKCIQLDIECAALCSASAEQMAINGEHKADLCLACADSCERCAEECNKHAEHEHCKRCAEICARCAEECRRIAA